MAKRNKLEKFDSLSNMPHVYENYTATDPSEVGTLPLVHMGSEVHMAGKWHEQFDNNHPIVLELACGRGEYTVALAKDIPQNNYIGVDIKGARMFQGASQAIDHKLMNAAFLRTRIEFLDHFFDKGEVAEIWVTFPDPFLRKSKAMKRLTSSRFLELYKKILKPDGLLHLKTDDDTLFEFSIESIQKDSDFTILMNASDIYTLDQLPHEALKYKTHYEGMHLAEGRTIKYIQAILQG